MLALVGMVHAQGSPKADAPLALGDGNHSVGAPFVEENLAVFPILAAKQEQIGRFVMLDAALKDGTAVVRELGADGHNAEGPQVNALAIENKGQLPVLVLAGTVVKGGNQDRQIGQDFVLRPNSTVSVNAYCVEHGRWQATREGQATSGKFETVPVLAQAKVRTAGQYEGNQSKVWDEVQQTNAATGKQAASGTLLASLSDKSLSAQREALAAKAAAFLGALKAKDDVVGVAYAVNGKVLAVRWFLNHELFAQNEGALLATAAMEALTGKAEALAAGGKVPDGKLAPSAVKDLVADAAKPKASHVAPTPAANTNAYRESDKAYGSEAVLKSGGKDVSVTADISAK
jgi:hypothetical protein